MVIALIVVVVVATAGVLGWMFVKNSQVLEQQTVAAQPIAPAIQSQQKSQSTVTTQETVSINADKYLEWTAYEMEGYSLQYPAKLYIPNIKGNESIGFGDDGFVFKSVTGVGKLGAFDGPNTFYVDSKSNDYMTMTGMEEARRSNYDTVTISSWALNDEGIIDADVLIAERLPIPNETKSLLVADIFHKGKHRMTVSFLGKPDDSVAKTIIGSFRWHNSTP